MILDIHGLNCVSLRLATVFGVSSFMRFDLLVNNFVYRAAVDGYIVLYEPYFIRNYIHVKDVVRAFEFCIDNWSSMKHEIYNVGLSDANLNKLQLCEEIQKVIPDFYFTSHPIAKDVDQRNYIVSNDKIEGKGFKPKYNLNYGICEIKKCVEMLNISKSQGNTPMRVG